MKDVAVFSFIIGLLLILGRGPFIFAPDASRKFYLKLLSTNNRVRILGLLPLALSVAMILSGHGEDQLAARVVVWFGCLLAFISLFGCLIFPSIVKLIAQALLEALDNVMLRGIGIISVLAGSIFIYLGFILLN